ncbi:MAG: aminotransferase class I/II-fold pyridoxal phosphate-dependent enzyme, partial [Chloroflexota bacterium]
MKLKTKGMRVDLFEKCRQFMPIVLDHQEKGIYPYFIPIESESGPEVVIGGRRVLMLGSNNYLGLTQHPAVKAAAKDAIDRYGSGCTGSRLLNGTLKLHEELERRLATFMHKEAALVFTTGFQANQGAISALADRHDTIVIDRSDHASIIDGCRLSTAHVVKYRHNDMDHLESLLKSLDGKGGVCIVADGVFSMDGDLANIPAMVRLKKRYGARLIIDDAHGIGALGKCGRGTLEVFGMEQGVDIVVGTFSKSLASIGGFVAGDKEPIEYIKHNARSMLFSASLPPASVAAAMAALEIVEKEPERRVRLWQNVKMMREGLESLGFDIGNSQSPVIPVIIGDNSQVTVFWRALFDAGLYTNCILSPGVPPGHELIRTSYMATHTKEHLERSLYIFKTVGKQIGII